MYITIPSYPNPYSTRPITDAVGFIGISNFDHFQGNGRLVLAIYPDAASAQADLPPIATREYVIPAVDPVADPNVTDPKFGLPSLKTIEAQNGQIFEALVGVFYQLLLADPALKGATPLTGTT